MSAPARASSDDSTLDFNSFGAAASAGSSPRGIGWRRRVLVVAVLLGCLGLFAFMRWLAAVPPPAPEEIAKLEKKLEVTQQEVPKLTQKLATATKRLAEAQQELPATEAKLAEKQQAADAALQAYQALLPKQG